MTHDHVLLKWSVESVPSLEEVGRVHLGDGVEGRANLPPDVPRAVRVLHFGNIVPKLLFCIDEIISIVITSIFQENNPLMDLQLD